MWSGVMTALLLLGLLAACTAASILSERDELCGAQAYQGFYRSYWVTGDCIGTFVPLTWAMLDAEGISEAFLL